MKLVPTAEQLVRAMQLKGHQVFDTPEGYNLNLVGIRAASATPDSFDDLLCLFHRRGTAWMYAAFPATTDPGLYWLQNPMAVEGTAILKPGQYFGAFKLGLHQGKYEALVQNSPLTVYRDNDRDSQIDTGGMKEQAGMFGINIHHAAQHAASSQVGKWSAGCQVVANWFDFQVLLVTCKAAAQGHSAIFSYTLIEERDLGVVN